MNLLRLFLAYLLCLKLHVARAAQCLQVFDVVFGLRAAHASWLDMVDVYCLSATDFTENVFGDLKTKCLHVDFRVVFHVIFNSDSNVTFNSFIFWSISLISLLEVAERRLCLIEPFHAVSRVG